MVRMITTMDKCSRCPRVLNHNCSRCPLVVAINPRVSVV
uniref:OEP80 n=1 Tax=Arundo donax TaxID=35708 RepID=A0A0A9E3N2_ARUDO